MSGYLEWLEAAGVPAEVAAELVALSVEPARGKWYLDVWGADDVLEKDEEFPQFRRDGFIVIGSCPNGDFIVLDLAGGPGAVGFVSHEEVWDAPHHVRDDLRPIYLRLAPTIAAFRRAAADARGPKDYWQLQERTGGY